MPKGVYIRNPEMKTGKHMLRPEYREMASNILKKSRKDPDFQSKLSSSLRNVPLSSKHKLAIGKAMKTADYGNGVCEWCNKEFKKKINLQKICKDCCPSPRYWSAYRVYGLTKEKYDSMLSTNNGMCWICLKRKAKVVDHDHATGKVRGLLCKFCNVSISLLDDKQIRPRVNAYLDSNIYSINIPKPEEGKHLCNG